MNAWSSATTTRTGDHPRTRMAMQVRARQYTVSGISFKLSGRHRFALARSRNIFPNGCVFRPCMYPVFDRFHAKHVAAPATVAIGPKIVPVGLFQVALSTVAGRRQGPRADRTSEKKYMGELRCVSLHDVLHAYLATISVSGHSALWCIRRPSRPLRRSIYCRIRKALDCSALPPGFSGIFVRARGEIPRKHSQR